VDDLLISTPTLALTKSVVEEVRKKWTCSEGEYLSPTTPLTFCGMEISTRGVEGTPGFHWRLNQCKYIKQLLEKHQMLNRNATKVPLTESFEADDVDYVRVLHSLGETPPASLVKSAQCEVGELLWLSVRSRPDLAYSVSRAASLAAVAPSISLLICKKIRRYLRGTLEYGLTLSCGEYKSPWKCGNAPELHAAIQAEGVTSARTRVLRRR
jgi:hypothetical protein